MNAAIKERPILFSGPMVRAILEGRKTQTRRVVKLKQFGPSDTPGYDWHFRDKRGLWNDYRNHELASICPYGKPGDRLWVRETWAIDDCGKQVPLTTSVWGDWPVKRLVYGADRDIPKFSKRPSIHMPRWASRITLEIIGVRVERLNDISNDDCVAEGITASGKAVRLANGSYAQAGRYENKASTVRQLFSELWTEINGPGSWSLNPWVCVVEFKRVQP